MPPEGRKGGREDGSRFLRIAVGEHGNEMMGIVRFNLHPCFTVFEFVFSSDWMLLEPSSAIE